MSMFNDPGQETLATAAAKLTPPVTLLSAKLVGLTIPEWIQVLTLIYVVLMIIHKLWQMGIEAWLFWRKKKE